MDISSLLPVFVVTLAAVGAGVLAMAIGVIFRRPCLRGSCGGSEVRTAGGESIVVRRCVRTASARPRRLTTRWHAAAARPVRRAPRALSAIIPAARVVTDPLRLLAWGTDASFYRLVPKIVVVVETEAEVVALLALRRTARDAGDVPRRRHEPVRTGDHRFGADGAGRRLARLPDRATTARPSRCSRA